MDNLDTRDAHRLYVKTDLLTGLLYEEEVLSPGEANRLNDELDSEGSSSRWMMWATREGEAAAA